MNTKNNLKNPVFFLMLVLLFSATGPATYATDFSTWERGSYGYDDIVEVATSEESPIVIYFADNSKPCLQFNKTYLDDTDVYNFLLELPKVLVNPKNERDKKLAGKYGGTPPAFFIEIPSVKSNPRKFGGGKQSVASFLEDTSKYIVNEYGKAANEALNEKNYNVAIKYFDLITKYKDDDPEIYFAIGAAYHTLGNKNRDSELQTLAKENYEKALELDPGHAKADKNLKTLLKYINQNKTKSTVY